VITSAADFTYNPHDADVMANPVPYYEVLREQFPMYYIREYDAYAISRFEDVYDVLSDAGHRFTGVEGTLMNRDQFLVRNGGVLPSWSRNPLPPFTSTDSPDYEDLRQAHVAPLRPKSVALMETFVLGIVRERLDHLLPQRSFNLTTEFGGIVAASTMCQLYGLPLDLARPILDMINSGSMTDPESGGLQAGNTVQLARQHREMIMKAVVPRRAAGADGSVPLVDDMVNFRLDGVRPLTDEEVCDQLVCVLVGGTETLPKVVAHGLMELWRHPDQLAEVRSDLSLNARPAFEEMTRYCGPAQWFTRQVREPITIGGTELKPGQRVILLMQSAARDPREFDGPDEFVWNRPIERNLAFSFGQHYCVGVHVAKLEGRIMIEEFLSRVHDFEIDEAGLVRLPSSFQWGYSVVPVTINDYS
jgi:cytochrome P450